MKSACDDWQKYERLVASLLINQLSTDMCVTPNARVTGILSGRSRQLDVLIDARHDTDNSRRIIVDAKKRKRKIDVTHVEAFRGLMEDVRATHGYLSNAIFGDPEPVWNSLGLMGTFNREFKLYVHYNQPMPESVESREPSDLTAEYGVVAELQRFIDAGFLRVMSQKPDEKTVEFYIPGLSYQDEQGRDTTFSIIWIHPNHNEQFCHYYDDKPGDLANFYIIKQTEDSGDECLDVETLDDLIAWLEEKKEIVGRRP